MPNQRWDARAYERSFSRLCAGAVEPLLDAVGAPGEAGGGRLLDLGTGTGQVAAAARRRGWMVDALDSDAAMVDRARDMLPGVDVVLADAERMPYPDGTFDAVLGGFVLNHVPHPVAALAEVGRVLRSGGRLAVTIWPAGISELNAMWNAVMAAAGARPPEVIRLPADQGFDRSPTGLSRLLASAGFTAVHAAAISWSFVIEPDLLWSAPEAGLATIGAAFLAQPEAGRRRMREAFGRLSRERAVDGVLTFPSLAVLGSARA